VSIEVCGQCQAVLCWSQQQPSAVVLLHGQLCVGFPCMCMSGWGAGQLHVHEGRGAGWSTEACWCQQARCWCSFALATIQMDMMADAMTIRSLHLPWFPWLPWFPQYVRATLRCVSQACRPCCSPYTVLCTTEALMFIMVVYHSSVAIATMPLVVCAYSQWCLQSRVHSTVVAT
jgi:hypothetical protein